MRVNIAEEYFIKTNSLSGFKAPPPSPPQRDYDILHDDDELRPTDAECDMRALLVTMVTVLIVVVAIAAASPSQPTPESPIAGMSIGFYLGCSLSVVCTSQ